MQSEKETSTTTREGFRQQERRTGEVTSSPSYSSTNASQLSKELVSQSTWSEEQFSSNNTWTPSSEASNSNPSNKENKNPIPFRIRTRKIKMKRNPRDWTVEEVINFISASDPKLACHANAFRHHEIDGRAFLLVTYDVLTKHMNIKLGPALKICNLVSNIKTNRNRKTDRRLSL
ncbi:Polycomb protein Scm [Armadillidium nasatum]|uniref:Polycomb protein Scm n=1 Tax=Armadillidium nasatum TaxID=96803 RepID=A0A5N5TCL9_9CRUS|nr:Polycomb protein Scm [Armadillidium nasatum]